MKLLLRKVDAWVRQRWAWSLLLVLCASLLVWWVGPLLAVNDYKFWASPTARLLSVSALLLGWGLGMVFANGRAGSPATVQENDTDQPGGPHRTRLDQEQREVRTRFKAAMRTLKTASSCPGQGKRRRNDLPWYLLIGPPASGKTHLLEGSGLEFLHKCERTPLDDHSGTRYCEWYFTEHAVLVDTAGRFLTQRDGDIDSHAWGVLLELLRKRRRGRPLSGVLLTVPTELLLLGSEGEIAALARQAQGRLQELKQRLHIDVPIYLVLSKADCVPGFNEFFDSLTREERDQVLGASFSRDPRASAVSEWRAHFEALLQRLNSQVILRMHQERDTRRRSHILDFPHQLEQLGANLCLLVEQAFAGSDRTLRGFYLTCAPQPGLAMKPSVGQGSAGAHTNSPFGEAPRFIHHLVSRVIFPEADLADLDQRERRLINWGQRTVYLAGLAILGLFGLLWANGFSTNHERLEHLRTLAQRWNQQQSAPVKGDDWITMLQSLDVRFEATQVFPPLTAVPWYERVGLYQGRASHAVVTDAYVRDLQTQLLPRIALRLEEHIRDNWNDREQLLSSLRAYLMLNRREHRDTEWLKDRLGKDGSLRHAGNTALQEGLNSHFARLLEQPFVFPLDETLVAQAREALRSESMAVVVYRMLYERASHLPHYRLSHHLGAQGASFTGTDHVIPGLYTRQGFERYFSVQGTILVSELLRDNWVLGDGEGLSNMDMRRLMAELEQLYFRDYANHWSEALGRVMLQPVTGIAEGAEQLAGLASAHSPILQLLVQVREHTRIQSVSERLDDAAPTSGKSGSIGKLVVMAGKGADALAENPPDTARRALQRRFDPLHRLLDADNGPTADLNQALRALDDLQLQLASLARAGAPEHAAFELARGRMGGQRDALSHLRSASGRLPRPVSAWFSGLADDSWRLVLNDSYRYLNQRYQNELYSFYGKAINKRYPFSAHSVSDVALEDFRAFFRNEGLVDQFFERYLRPFVSGTPGHYKLRSVDGQSLPMSEAYLDQMTTAHTIRRSFFAHDPATPQVQFTLEPYTLDPTVSRSEFRFGDKTLEYRHGPILPMAFSWPSDAQAGRAALVLEKMTGRGVGIEKNTGPWSLFRLFDLMPSEYLSGRAVTVLKADLGGLRANYLLTSQRAPNPFDMEALRTFRMPVQL
ncbi:type VI secretion system membrane subunit TssM [Pseudomonas citrulli]|uniref:Type VI secretion system membrane subunit TssM n=1 Tax=Pseudomonas citrulli TaxID=3064347 RepID=A0ABT9C0C0_9PSED|nr:type VI secretion system membrane subunit TssM [Pseudomonas sp. K18]MDO7896637.1 type VI secretion system membrane subunit TssM [Pseudomonas sp. K18]